MTQHEISQIPVGTKLIVRPWEYSDTTIIATLSGFEPTGKIRVMTNSGSYYYLSPSRIDDVF